MSLKISPSYEVDTLLRVLPHWGRVCHGPRRRNCSCAPTYHNSLFQAVMLFKGSPPLPSLSLYHHRRSFLPSCSPSRNGLALFSCPVCSCRHKPQVSTTCSNTAGKLHSSGQCNESLLTCPFDRSLSTTLVPSRRPGPTHACLPCHHGARLSSTSPSVMHQQTTSSTYFPNAWARSR